MTAATIYMSLMGPQGLERTAAASHARTRELVSGADARERACAPRSRGRSSTRRWCCSIVRWRRCSRRWRAAGSSAGSISPSYYPELGQALLVCATETKTTADIEQLLSPRSAKCMQAARGGLRMKTMRTHEKVIFEYSHPGRGATDQWPRGPGAGARPPTCPRSCGAAGAAAARGRRAGGRAALHAPVATQLLDRHALLSARVVHDEVQPEGLQPVRDVARVPGPPSARRRSPTARASSPACTSCRRC